MRAHLLDAVAPTFFGDPLYIFARMHQLYRSGQPIEAARFLLEARPDLDLSGDGDIWWEERRDLARALLDSGTPELAYRVVAASPPGRRRRSRRGRFSCRLDRARFLHDPNRAEPHFRELHTLATLPRTQSRASYWLGRTHEAQQRPAAAHLDYVEAARFGGTFYGQLAREKLGITTTGLERMPRPSALDRIRFADRELVKVVRLLAAAGHADMASPFLAALGETVDTPGEVALLTTLARRIGRPEAGSEAAAEAEERGLKVACLPALFFGVPADLRTPERGRPGARLRRRPSGKRVQPHGRQPCRRARLDAAHASDRARNGAQRQHPFLRAATHHRPALQCHPRRASSGRAPWRPQSLLRADVRRLQRRPWARAAMGARLRRSARR